MPRLIREVLSTTIVVMAMRAGVMACKFGLAIFIGRYFDLSSLGLYGLTVGAIAIVPAIIGMGMVHLIMRDAVTVSVTQMTSDLRQYWCFTTLVYAAALAFSVLLAIVLGISELWVLVIVIMLLEHLGNDIFLLLSNLERPLLANVTAFIRGAAWILIYIPAAIWDPSLRTLPILFGFWFAGSALAFVVFVYASRTWPWKAAFALPLSLAWIIMTIKQSFIIYISDVSFTASQYVDRYLVTMFLGLELAGIYFLYWSVANAASTLVSMAVLQLQRPLLIRAHHEGGAAAHRQLTSSLMRTTALASITIGIATGCAFLIILPLLKQPAVAHHLAAFWLIMAGIALRNIADFGAMALFTARRDRLMTLTNVVTIVMLVLAQAMLLPLAGLYGAGLAMLVTFTGAIIWRHKLIFNSSSGSESNRTDVQRIDA